jgi:addiction module RelE/StbE family toxin
MMEITATTGISITRYPANGTITDCHISPDLVLIYRKPDDDSLELVRLGSRSELGL